PGSAI
ncbi:hypothetical protein D030_4111B, partial [Vibrio parahaemolyticus AQ3810]